MSNLSNNNDQDAGQLGAVPPVPLGGAPTTPSAPSHFAPKEDNDKPRRTKRRVAIVLGVIVVVLVAAYGAGAYVFSQRFYPGTTIVDCDVSWKTADEAASALEDEAGNYELSVQGDGFDWRFSPSVDTPVFDMGNVAASTLAQNEPLLWPYRLARAATGDAPHIVDQALDPDEELDRSLLSASFDEQAFIDDIGEAVDTFNEGRSGVFDAAGSYDADAGAFTIDKARSNEKLDRDNITHLALAALSRMDTEAALEVLGAEAFEPLAGGLTDDELQAACDAANELLGCDVTFKLGSSQAATLDGSVIAPWITFDENLTPTLDQAQVTAWAQQLAQSLNTVGTTRSYTRADGKQITVAGGTFGWRVDEAAVVQAVQDAVTNRQTGEVELPCSSQGDVYNGAGQPDWGAYIDVDIAEQYARYYDASGALLWETGIVTGKPDGENDTPTGVYRINNKLRNITLIGQKDPETGEPEYESPVDYWIAFVGSSIGFHDASWQNPSVYSNPRAYRWAGSHGCINTPYNKVAQLYDMVSPGLCVIVHQ